MLQSNNLEITPHMLGSFIVKNTQYKTSNLAAIMLSIVLVLITSFDYVWIGPLPVWLYAIILSFFLVIFHSRARSNLINSVNRLSIKIIFPWILFIFVVTMLDMISGTIDKTLSTIVILNLSALFLLIMTVTWSSMVNPSFVIYLLGCIAMAQGILCVAQFMGIEQAWSFPQWVSENISTRKYLSTTINMSFEQIQRVRGTNLFVHKFNPMQGMLVSFLFVILMLQNKKNYSYFVSKYFLIASVSIGLIGMILTFSRSTALGFAITIFIVLFLGKRMSSIGMFILFFIVVAGIGSSLSLTEGREYSRIYDMSEKRDTNAARLNHIYYAVKSFSESPIYGNAKTASNVGTIHSVLLRILTDYGLLGLMPYLFVLIGIYKVFRNSQLKIIGMGALCALIVVLIDSWTHTSGLLVSDVAQPGLIGTFIGLLYGFNSINNKRSLMNVKNDS